VVEKFKDCRDSNRNWQSWPPCSGHFIEKNPSPINLIWNHNFLDNYFSHYFKLTFGTLNLGKGIDPSLRPAFGHY